MLRLLRQLPRLRPEDLKDRRTDTAAVRLSVDMVSRIPVILFVCVLTTPDAGAIISLALQETCVISSAG